MSATSARSWGTMRFRCCSALSAASAIEWSRAAEASCREAAYEFLLRALGDLGKHGDETVGRLPAAFTHGSFDEGSGVGEVARADAGRGDLQTQQDRKSVV